MSGTDTLPDPTPGLEVDEPQRRRRRPVLRTYLIAVVVVLVLALVGWLILFSPVLGVRTVTVRGAVSLSAGQVRAAAGIARGAPLARLDTGAVAHRVEALPDVAHATVRVSYPSTVVVEVTERTAVGYQSQGGSSVLVDAAGARFRTVPSPPSGLPLLTFAGSDRAAATAVAGVAAALGAPVRALVASIDPVVGTIATDPGLVAVSLTLIDKRIVAWGTATDNAVKARILPALLRQPGRHFDLSNPKIVVVD